MTGPCLHTEGDYICFFLLIFIILRDKISQSMKSNICLLVLGALSLLMLSGCYRLGGGHIELSESYVELPSSGGERTVYALGNQFQIISISFKTMDMKGGFISAQPTMTAMDFMSRSPYRQEEMIPDLTGPPVLHYITVPISAVLMSCSRLTDSILFACGRTSLTR